MKVNTKTQYGLRVMVEIAIASQQEGILQKDIATKQQLSYKYLDLIIANLKSAGLICNVGGRKSGYRLKIPTGRITVYDVYRAFNEDLSIVEGLAEGNGFARGFTYVTSDFWQGLNGVIRDKLRAVTLSMLVEKQLYMGKTSNMYHI